MSGKVAGCVGRELLLPYCGRALRDDDANEMAALSI
jgi:hypothetical protein